MLCHTCQTLQESKISQQRCVCCGDALHFRKKNSISRTWALCIAASIFMVFANIYPIMTITYLGNGSPSTIIAGVIELLEHGMYPIAAVVFIASIAVPLLKLAALFWLLLTVEFQWQLNARQCALMYRMVSFIGRWSMLDLFVIAILVALVNLGNLATIAGGAGATFFSSVVVLTMLAAHSFDPRIIWDLHEIKNRENNNE